MTQPWHFAAARKLAVAAVCVACAGMPALEVLAQQPAKEQPRKAPAKKGAPKEGAEAGATGKTDLVTAQRMVEAGITHLEAGRLDAAVSSLSSGLAAGSLPAAQTARALHYRGVAFRRQGKPAQALSDLTSALSLRNGLNDSQRSEALRERAAAYRDAGLPDQSEADSVRAAAKGTSTPPAAATAASTTTAATTAAARTSTAAAPPAASSGGGIFGSWFGGGSSKAEPAPKAAPPPPPAQTAAAWTSSVEVRPTAAEPKGRPDVKTAAIARPAPAPPPPPARAPKAEPKVAKPEPKPAKAAKAAPAPKGDLRVQVALVRSRAEAEALAGQIKQKHAGALGNRQASIDEVVMGNMGTFYRLRLGPYADASEPRALCASLRSDGLHCGGVTP